MTKQKVKIILGIVLLITVVLCLRIKGNLDKNSNEKKNLENQRLAVMALKRTQPGIEKIKFSHTYAYSKYGEWSIDAEIIKDGKLYKRKLYKTGTAYGAPLTDSDYNVPTKEPVIVVYSNGQQEILV